MKVIKRDGRVVDYDKTKVEIAIEKANKEVIEENEKANKEDIKKITNYIEKLGRKRILVEDIQDIIEQKLMEIGKYELAKKYIVYRYTRALVRKSNTTDETILGLIRNQNKEGKNSIDVSSQRDFIAGEVSKDLTKRLLLPEKISKANEGGVLYFHYSDFFLQPIIGDCATNIKDMLINGTVLNEVKIDNIQSFQNVCNIITQIIAQVGSNIYGTQYIDLSILGRCLKQSKEKKRKEINEKLEKKVSQELIDEIIDDIIRKDLNEGISILKHQLKTLNTTRGKKANAIIYLDLNQEKEYLKENLIIKQEILNQMPEKLTEEKKKIIGKFSQGIVSINLSQIAIMAEENEKVFYEMLEERLDLCKEALMCRHYQLLGTISDVSPILWQNGAISRLKPSEKINKLLLNKFSSLSLGYIGTKEVAEIMKKKNTEEEKNEFILNLLKKLKETIEKWKKETNIEFVLDGHPPEDVKYKFAKKDKERFGTIKNVTDKGYYTN